jgi:hypothetical protein
MRLPPLALPDLRPSEEACAIGPSSKFAPAIAALVALVVFVGGSAFKPTLFWLFGLVAWAAYWFTFQALSKQSQLQKFKGRLSAKRGLSLTAVRPFYPVEGRL